MDLWNALSRAKRGLRDDLGLHVVAVASLVIAFLCLGAALLSVENLSRVADRWGRAQHLTVYLIDKALDTDVAQLRLVLESLQEVASVQHVSAIDAKREFAEQIDPSVDAAALPTDAFPASLEVTLRSEADAKRVAEMAERVKRFSAVEHVETYHDWLQQVASLVSTARSAVGLLALLVAICVLAIIGNTIRLAVLSRKREIEVLKLCGATDGYVRSPFLLEGAIQAAAAAFVSMLLLLFAYLALRGTLESTLSAITGVRLSFLPPLTMLAVIFGGAIIGAFGSALSLRRHLRV
jgi:cell division transport system permease protein